MKEDIIIGPAVPADIDGVLELIYMKPPSAWMRRISRACGRQAQQCRDGGYKIARQL